MSKQLKARFVTNVKTLSYEVAWGLYESLRDRCYNEKSKYYQGVGGKGIGMCEEWIDFDVFQEFLEDIGFTDDSRLVRIDTKKGYFPDNLKCEKIPEKSRFKRKFIEYRGQVRGLSSWDVFFSFERGTFSKMLKTIKKHDDAGATVLMECAEKLYKNNMLVNYKELRKLFPNNPIYGSPFCEDCDILDDPND